MYVYLLGMIGSSLNLGLGDMPYYLAQLQKSLGFSEDKLSSMMVITKMEEKTTGIFDFYASRDGVSSQYGYIAFSRDTRGKYEVVYAVHSLTFRLGPRLEKVVKPGPYFFSSPTEEEVLVPPRLNLKDIRSVQVPS